MPSANLPSSPRQAAQPEVEHAQLGGRPRRGRRPVAEQLGDRAGPSAGDHQDVGAQRLLVQGHRPAVSGAIDGSHAGARANRRALALGTGGESGDQRLPAALEVADAGEEADPELSGGHVGAEGVMVGDERRHPHQGSRAGSRALGAQAPPQPLGDRQLAQTLVPAARDAGQPARQFEGSARKAPRFPMAHEHRAVRGRVPPGKVDSHRAQLAHRRAAHVEGVRALVQVEPLAALGGGSPAELGAGLEQRGGDAALGQAARRDEPGWPTADDDGCFGGDRVRLGRDHAHQTQQHADL